MQFPRRLGALAVNFPRIYRQRDLLAYIYTSQASVLNLGKPLNLIMRTRSRSDAEQFAESAIERRDPN